MRPSSGSRILGLTALIAMVATTCVVAPAGAASDSNATAAASSSFYAYHGSKPLADYKPGTVLKTRTIAFHLSGVPLPLHVTQLVYRSSDALGHATADVTSVLKAPLNRHKNEVISYQSFYDSLNPEDGPSRSFAGGTTLGQSFGTAESGLIAPFLLQGYSVIVADTEGPAADFSAGPEYGKATLDSIRAVSNSPSTGIGKSARVGLIGYSGGAIATNWAAALAPTYAPDVNKRLVGATEGGVLVDPDHNLHYINGSLVWAGVAVMSLIGIARSYDINLEPYLNAYGRKLFAKMKRASIVAVLGEYPGLTFAKIAKPKYSKPESIPAFVRVANKLNLGSRPSPTIPMFIGQGANGVLEGTSGSTPGIGKGDGVMVAGDVRSLARKYCAAGTRVKYQQYNATSHVTTVPLYLPSAITWLTARFGTKPAPRTCGSIAPGNSLKPVRAPAGR